MSGIIQTRPARQGDVGELGALKLRSSLAWGDHLDELQALPEARAFPREHLPFAIVAELAGAIAGFATLLPPANGEAEIEDLFVDPPLWRKGIGRALMAALEARALSLGAGSLHVIANNRALPFYRSAGFEIVGTVATRFAPAPEMRKALAQG
jgi:GNAT superfamily N-acetyltransferase